MGEWLTMEEVGGPEAYLEYLFVKDEAAVQAELRSWIGDERWRKAPRAWMEAVRRAFIGAPRGQVLAEWVEAVVESKDTEIERLFRDVSEVLLEAVRKPPEGHLSMLEPHPRAATFDLYSLAARPSGITPG